MRSQGASFDAFEHGGRQPAALAGTQTGDSILGRPSKVEEPEGAVSPQQFRSVLMQAQPKHAPEQPYAQSRAVLKPDEGINCQGTKDDHEEPDIMEIPVAIDLMCGPNAPITAALKWCGWRVLAWDIEIDKTKI